MKNPLTGKQIKMLRERKGMSQREGAVFLGVTEKTLCNWEQEKATLRPIVAYGIEHMYESISDYE